MFQTQNNQASKQKLNVTFSPKDQLHCENLFYNTRRRSQILREKCKLQKMIIYWGYLNQLSPSKYNVKASRSDTIKSSA